ncbi:hypothetical protein K0M31_005540 [Melipona bicolor]|uniref:Uncharacterized protein n=1 Tax=Melipona bicolor TaxID=60889 RepID=A0AA40FV91_9HYME|nr:hypothetical protein K0M31_005540 [Melipona bicolor]
MEVLDWLAGRTLRVIGRIEGFSRVGLLRVESSDWSAQGGRSWTETFKCQANASS